MKRMIESIENVIQMDKGVIDVLVSHCRQKEEDLINQSAGEG